MCLNSPQRQRRRDDCPRTAYIGGVDYGTGCTTPPGQSWVDTVTNSQTQDWRLVFTWVGPQAPSSCSPGGGPYPSYISTNTSTAYNQGDWRGRECLLQACVHGRERDECAGRRRRRELQQHDHMPQRCVVIHEGLG